MSLNFLIRHLCGHEENAEVLVMVVVIVGHMYFTSSNDKAPKSTRLDLFLMGSPTPWC